jgi:response regulator RpfG family c-di-GMP phosphodiesterase
LRAAAIIDRNAPGPALGKRFAPARLLGHHVERLEPVIAVAEVYDALTTARPYQDKMTPELAVERMADLSGTVLDPQVYEALVRIVGRRQTLVFLDEDAGPTL